MKSVTATPFCKVCFGAVKAPSYRLLFEGTPLICPSCYQKLEPHFRFFRLQGKRALSLFEPGPGLKALLRQYADCGDAELAPVFLDYPKRYLRLRFRGYLAVPLPKDGQAGEEDSLMRIYEGLGLSGARLFPKMDGTSLRFSSSVPLRGKRVLLLGALEKRESAIEETIRQLEAMRPAKIEILLLAYAKS